MAALIDRHSTHDAESRSARPLTLRIETIRRVPLFADFDLACAAARVFGAEPLDLGVRCRAWVLLPCEVELLLEGACEAELPALVRRLKRASAAAVNRERAVSATVWSRGFDLWLLPGTHEIEYRARELIERPLRAGLVARLGDYPFWNAREIWPVGD
jgi:hypothetical protein